MQNKTWEVCLYCLKNKECVVGAERIKGLEYNSPTVPEIGCYDYEIYKKQLADKQMKLF